jgi:hypothetical protein
VQALTVVPALRGAGFDGAAVLTGVSIPAACSIRAAY